MKRRIRLAPWAVAFLAVAPTQLAGQASAETPVAGGEPVVIGHRHTVRSPTLGEERVVLVHTPPGYSRDGAYPVVYLLDGEGHFGHVSGIADFLVANNRMPPVIVVGVGNTDRTRDLTPPAPSDTARAFPTAGGADRFLAFLLDELAPWLEERYAVAPYRVLVGHSFGGLFSTHALLSRPGAFQAHISVSPSLWWDAEGVVRRLEAELFKGDVLPTEALYVTMGNEGGNMLAGAWGLTRVLETRAPDGFRWKWAHMTGEDHGSVPHRSIYDGFEWLFEPWSLPTLWPLLTGEPAAGLVRVRAHYDGLSARHGFPVRPPEGTINQIGYALLRQHRAADAVLVFEANVSWYPRSANTYDSLGDGLAGACRHAEALARYEEAVARAPAEHPNREAYERKRNELRARLEGQGAAGAPCPTGGVAP